MTKQTYDVVRYEDRIEILKNEMLIYSVFIEGKTLNLLELYNSMEIKLDDEIFVKKRLESIQDPKNDSERIYNNVIDFFNNLLVSISAKLQEIRDIKSESVFE